MPNASRNRTLRLLPTERASLRAGLVTLEAPATPEQVLNRTLCQDIFQVLPYLPSAFVDLLIIDPPYNLTRKFGSSQFRQTDAASYQAWVESWLLPLRRTLRPNASLYICGDWRSSPMLYQALAPHFHIRNRITWEREKGRGSRSNWKNTAEDIWFCTLSDEYTFQVDAVKLKRRVMAPYRRADGAPKDWEAASEGNFRLTHPSNLWTDLTVPFWSMPENTEHPTQKPEKLLAKLILASSRPGDVVLDPFLGSGTTSVVAKKLGRRYVGIEIDETYACLAEKRLALAESDRRIQGYVDGVFWERNTRP